MLVLDEPTTGLGPAGTRQLADLFRPVTEGRTVIVITHDPAVAAKADRAIALGFVDRATTAPAAGVLRNRSDLPKGSRIFPAATAARDPARRGCHIVGS